MGGGALRMKYGANLMTNTDERAYYYYSETEACSQGPGTQFGFNLAPWEIDPVLFFIFTADRQNGGENRPSIYAWRRKFMHLTFLKRSECMSTRADERRNTTVAHSYSCSAEKLARLQSWFSVSQPSEKKYQSAQTPKGKVP